MLYGFLAAIALWWAAALPSAAPVFTVSGNFPRDLYGPIDTRMPSVSCNAGPCIWGHADSESLPITFHVPPGHRVRLLALRGDLIAWPKVMDAEEPVKPGAAAGVLAGFSTSQQGGSRFCDYCADHTPLYVQGAVSDQPVRIAFDYDLRHEQVYLDSDKLWLKLAEYLNNTGHAIHMEATYTIVFSFERR